MRSLLFIMMLAACATARAELYKVTKVHSYNVVEVQLEKGAGSKSGTKMRIKNLEQIEYISNTSEEKRKKVLLGGSDPKKLLEQMVLGETVWIDQIESINGENVGHLYLSYEQVISIYMDRRMAGSYTVSPAVKQKLISVHKRMISYMKNGSPTTNTEKTKAYENEYSKALFVYDGLNWFKKTGQFLPSGVQALYVDWLSDYLGANGSSARELEAKIKDMQKRSDLYRDFLFDD